MFWLFQNQPDRILSLCGNLPVDAAGYSFVAPMLKEREYRLDGLFRPPADRPDLPALILDAQMAPDPGFLRWLYAQITTPASAGASDPSLAAGCDGPSTAAQFRSARVGG